MISAAALIGVLGSGGAIAFRWLIDTIEYYAWGGAVPEASAADSLLVIGVPTAGGLIVGILIYFSTREAVDCPTLLKP